MAVAGFEPVDILLAIRMLVDRVNEGVARVGQGGLAGAFLSELKDRASHSSLRPSVAAADTERGRLATELNPPPRTPWTRPQVQETGTWDAKVKRWRSPSGGFVAGPRR